MSAASPRKEYGQPIGDRVLVKLMERTQKKGTIFIPEVAQEKSSMGIVVAVGPGRMSDTGLIPMNVSTGDSVLFGKYAGSEIEIQDETLTIMREDEILLRLPKGVQ